MRANFDPGAASGTLNQPMRHIISILMQNEAGALVRVAGMFSQRGFNIESLNVAPTDNETVSRLTLVTTGTEDVVNQINRQLLKLVDVIDVLDMTDGEHVERELMFFKVRENDDDPVQTELVGMDHIEEIDRRDGILTLQFFGTSVEVDDLVARLTGSGDLLEVMRSGALAVTPGDKGLRFVSE